MFCQADLDEMSSESRMSEEKAQRAMVDAARLADELRMEQDAAVQLERDRKVVEAQVRDTLVVEKPLIKTNAGVYQL